jgi:excinuclease ABC subunit C
MNLKKDSEDEFLLQTADSTPSSSSSSSLLSYASSPEIECINALERGRQVLLHEWKTLPRKPGVYFMIGEHDEVLYIGKAKNLKNRLSSYTKINDLMYRTQRMVSLVHHLKITVTQSESEALFLEADLIRTLKPPFNILLKESTPFISISIQKSHPFPAIRRHRGARDEKKEDYLGPFSSIKSVEDAFVNIQKVFQLRTCSDSQFAKRTRPCLLYDMKRCSAPCVSKISQEDYRKNIKLTKDFLAGKLSYVRETLKKEMLEASRLLKYEQAACLRDRQKNLAKMSSIEKESTGSLVNADIIALFLPTKTAEHKEEEAFTRSLRTLDPSENKSSAMPLLPCIHVLFIRNKTYLGGDTFFLKKESYELAPSNVMEFFLQQFYLQNIPPKDILTNVILDDSVVLEEALRMRYQKTVRLSHAVRGKSAFWVKKAEDVAFQKSQIESSKQLSFPEMLKQLAEVFALSKVPQRVEIYDNSHIQGAHAYGCMVVATSEGFDKKSYRKFSVAPHKEADKSQKGGSDFAMMEEMLRRRLQHREDSWPDLIILDGGIGQVSSVLNIFREFDIFIPLIGVAKGPARNAGQERFFIPGWAPFSLPLHDPLLHFIQMLRDEAHRFAIGTHRTSRSVDLVTSQLNNIPGVGPVRKKELLKKFGSVQGVKQASLEELEQIPGITPALAKTIFHYFR